MSIPVITLNELYVRVTEIALPRRFSLVMSRAAVAKLDNSWMRGFRRSIRRRTHGGKLT